MNYFILQILLNSNLDNSITGMLTSLNERLTYIEENLGTLTQEEYTCNGSINFGTVAGYSSVSKTIYFDKMYLEAPAVSPSVVADGDTSTLQITISDITTSGCNVSIYNSIMRGYNTYGVVLSWTATGYVKKVS